MNMIGDIKTLSEFKQNASKLVKQVQKTKQPIILTVNGKPVAVVQNQDVFQQMSESNDYYETVQILKERIDDIDDPKKWISIDEAFDQVRKKHNIERD
jgi:prevent-host-death family protein